MILTELLKDSAYKLTQFTDAQIQALENQVCNKTTIYVICPAVEILDNAIVV